MISVDGSVPIWSRSPLPPEGVSESADLATALAQCRCSTPRAGSTSSANVPSSASITVKVASRSSSAAERPAAARSPLRHAVRTSSASWLVSSPTRSDHMTRSSGDRRCSLPSKLPGTRGSTVFTRSSATSPPTTFKSFTPTCYPHKSICRLQLSQRQLDSEMQPPKPLKEESWLGRPPAVRSSSCWPCR